jgi:hypothetical protein
LCLVLFCLGRRVAMSSLNLVENFSKSPIDAIKGFPGCPFSRDGIQPTLSTAYSVSGTGA